MTIPTMTIAELPCKRPRANIDPESGSVVVDNGQEISKFSVLSDSGHTYVVAETTNDEMAGNGILGTWTCTCQAGVHGQLCKHVPAVIEYLQEIKRTQEHQEMVEEHQERVRTRHERVLARYERVRARFGL